MWKLRCLSLCCVACSLALLLGCDSTSDAVSPSGSPAVTPVRATSTVAQGQIPFTTDLEAAYQQAEQQGQPLLLFFTAEWCTYCHQMADEAFVNEQVVELAQRFVCVLIDADQRPDVCRQFQVRGYPTVQFVSPQGVPLNRMVGKKAAHQVLSEMHAALQSLARRPANLPDDAIRR